MRLRGQSDDQVDVRLSIDELVVLRNVLHEIVHNMHFTENDFPAIFGVTRSEIEVLLLRSTHVLDGLRLTSE
jgi:hypothetical protein